METQIPLAVVFGGRSSEHEISLRSAVYVLRNLPPHVQALLVGIDRQGRFWCPEGFFSSQQLKNVTHEALLALVGGASHNDLGLRTVSQGVFMPLRKEVLAALPQGPLRVLNREVDCVFPVLHGPNGEDGRFQGVLEMAELAYVGCDLRASAIGMDKHVQKRLAAHGGVPVVPYIAVDGEAWETTGGRDKAMGQVEQTLSYPVFVKPNALGSAVGIRRANNRQELGEALENAFRFDTCALVEQSMAGSSEVECAFMGSAANPKVTQAGEIVPKDFYSYEAKYIQDDGAAVYVPARLEPEALANLQKLAKNIATALGLEGLSRIDFWKEKGTGRFVFNEVNTLPGLTSISLFPKLWALEGVGAVQWIDTVVKQALERAKKRQSLEVGVG